MKVKRYVAASMREALDKVREDLGPDVLILGNRKTDEGVEILVSEAGDLPPAETVRAEKPKRVAAVVDDDTPRMALRADDEPRQEERPKVRQNPVDSQDLWTHSDLIANMQNELAALKSLVEQQLAGFAWGAYGHQHPERAVLLRELVKLGVTPTLARDILDGVPPELERKAAWHRALGLIGQRIRILPENRVEEGVFLLCGPSGVGKTSSIAKLAARRSLARGADDMAIISADNQRIGAHQQLKSIGRILGVAVQQVESVSEIEAAGEIGRPGHLTLIDTAGAFSQVNALSDEIIALQRRLRMPVQPLLVLAANMDTPTLEATLEAFEGIGPVGVIITKTDEARNIGAVVSLVAEHGLPVAFVSEGPRIPDDMKPARGHEIVADLAGRRSQAKAPVQDLGLACERGFEQPAKQPANWRRAG